MLLLENPSQLKFLNLPNILCAIGVFDGIHLGHKKIISAIKQAAKEHNGTSIVVTFDKHPYNILNPSMHIPLLTSKAHKLLLMESLGIDVCIMMEFTKTICDISAETWIKEVLWNQMRIKAIYLGTDSFFGKEAKGDINLLYQWGKKLGFLVVKLDMARIENLPISSTTIRNFIIKGDLVSARKYLGRQYSVFGSPIKGIGKGKELGFPTINLDTQDQCLPPNGVYAVVVSPEPIKKLNIEIPAVANLGISPTFGIKHIKPILEVHLLKNKEGIIYNTIEVIFKEKIRDEIRFNTVSELTSQIEKDIAFTKNIFSSL